VSGLFVFAARTQGIRGRSRVGIEEKKTMANQVTQEKSKKSLSLDGWAVGIALLLAALVKLGALKHVGW
jgi:hypothetical protein